MTVAHAELTSRFFTQRRAARRIYGDEYLAEMAEVRIRIMDRLPTGLAPTPADIQLACSAELASKEHTPEDEILHGAACAEILESIRIRGEG